VNNRLLSQVAVSAALTVAGLNAADVLGATSPADPPLGILIVPGDEVPSAPAQTAPAEGTRPLGVLLGPGAPPAARQPAVPVNPFPDTDRLFSQPGQAGTQPSTPESSSDRPLGVLLDTLPAYAPPPATAPQAAVPQGFSAPVPTVPVAAPIASPAIGNATADRPLGTLIGSDPLLPAVAPSAVSPAVPATTMPLGPAAPASDVPSDTAGEEGPPIHFLADEMSFDREKGIVTASGNVEIRYDDRTLRAESVSYDQNKDIASASGNVILVEPTGERLFGDKMEISGDLKDAVVLNIGMILQDHSRIAGTGARHSGGNITELRKGVYSPCEPCAEDPNAPPLWQIKAVKVIHNKEEKTVEYRDAWIEFFGYPVAYTPYFRHPDPTVRRKTGFLFPKIGNSSDFGTILETPFFWAISDSEDLTARPVLMTEEFPLLALQYRKRFLTGSIDAEGSITDNSEDSFTTEEGEFGVRGHIDAEARFDINRTWRWGVDVKRSTDDTFLRRYGFASPQSLDSQVFVEGIKGRDYYSAKTLVFQGLAETDEHDESPIVLPLVDYNHLGERDRLGGRFNFDFNLLALTRAKGTDTRRLSMRPRWERPFQGPFGDLFRFETGLNADFYHTNGLVISGQDGTYSGASYRMVPYADLNWRLPLVKSQGTVRQILEPIASLALAPNGGNPDKIPNEDSTDFEYDETNLFSVNRFSGIDKVEGGARINYGLKWGVYGEGGGSSSLFVGQTYRFRDDSTFGKDSGLGDKLSDVVGSISVSPNSLLNVLYRTQLTSDDFSPRRNEVSFSAGVPALTIQGSYSLLEPQEESEFSGREELKMNASTVIDRFWRASLSAVRDQKAAEMRSLVLSAIYENECVIFNTQVTRTFFEDRDLKPTDAITFHLVLKTVGEVRSGASISSN
jgi:LPS-assembly protein